MTKEKVMLEEMLKLKNEMNCVDSLALESIREKAEKNSKAFGDTNLYCALHGIYSKYSFLIPYKFEFLPEREIPEVFSNEKAFMIWTVWRAGHILNRNDMHMLNQASIKAAKKAEELARHYANPNYTEKEKRDIISEFNSSLMNRCKSTPEYWNQYIFPILEGKRKFKYEVINNR